ncbi:hypothetical protein GCM10008927_27410 [Amylibacter ulvae]|uniref:Uncharacterized protein n=1 Tax=Paramylibacter ulvae TaxID=1651968 RepID=A0ABQ3D7M8_9RHOB|nr:hypothetical protein [Amylibacter ulvae]GHA60398.1 hypothetical protein GCM10008927_27410 [Amylibacter ulvae]
MKPIKSDEFVSNTALVSRYRTINLTKFGMYYAAPIENGEPVLTLCYDAQSGRLVAAH